MNPLPPSSRTLFTRGGHSALGPQRPSERLRFCPAPALALKTAARGSRDLQEAAARRRRSARRWSARSPRTACASPTELLARQRARLRPARTRPSPRTPPCSSSAARTASPAPSRCSSLFGERRARLRRPLRQREDADRPLPRAGDQGRRRRRGPDRRFWNDDADQAADRSRQVLAELEADGVRAVHLVNGIAAGATKRYAEHGPTLVKDVDVAFDPVLQVPGLLAARRTCARSASSTSRSRATSTSSAPTSSWAPRRLLWAEPLGAAGLLVKGESVVAFCDYDFPADDPVYAMGPLAGAKQLQRKTMGDIPTASARDRAPLLPARWRRPRSAPSPAAS